MSQTKKCVTTPRRKRQTRGSDALKYLEENAHHEAQLKNDELAFCKEQAKLENNKRFQLEQTRQEQLQEQAQQQMQHMQQQAALQNQQFNMLQQQMQQQMYQAVSRQVSQSQYGK